MSVEAKAVVKITAIVGNPNCVSPEDGEQVYQQIVEALQLGKQVDISFAGIENLTSSFLHFAIGQLYGKFSEAELKNRLKPIDASQDDLALLKRSVDRAKAYFKNPGPFEKAAQEIVGEADE